MTANTNENDGRTIDGMQAMIDELKALVTAQSEQMAHMAKAPAVTSNRRKAPVVVVDGVTLMDQPDKASQMKRLAAASIRNLDRLLPLRIKAMLLGGKPYRIVTAQGVAPMVEINLGDGETALYDLYAGSGDWTDYYLVKA